MNADWTSEVTVAAVAERDGRFLLVEEEVAGRLVFNQPAGHLEPDESLYEAVVRETLEETAHHFTPDGIVGLYLWRSPRRGTTILRTAFRGVCTENALDHPLDDGIHRTVWLTRSEILARQDRLRSPFVLRCIDDYLSGQSFPLDLAIHMRAPPAASKAS